MGAARRLSSPTVLARPARSLARRPAPAWGQVGGSARWKPGVDPAIRPGRPHVIPREPPSFVPKPPPPDWSLEAPVPPPSSSVPAKRRADGALDAWPTSLLTLPSPIYQPLAPAARPAPPPRRRRVALGSLAAAVALASLALAFWQLYWFLEASAGGRALLDRGAAIVAAIADRF